jgi:hypothetical protein
VIKVAPLKGFNSLKALNAFHALLLGLKMLPAYIGESYETFYEKFKDKTDGEKETFMREAVAFVQLAQDEVEALASFACDKNGVPYSQANIKTLGPQELHEIIVAVCMEIGRIKIDLVSEDEKKKFRPAPSTSEPSSSSTLN